MESIVGLLCDSCWAISAFKSLFNAGCCSFLLAAGETLGELDSVGLEGPEDFFFFCQTISYYNCACLPSVVCSRAVDRESTESDLQKGFLCTCGGDCLGFGLTAGAGGLVGGGALPLVLGVRLVSVELLLQWTEFLLGLGFVAIGGGGRVGLTATSMFKML